MFKETKQFSRLMTRTGGVNIIKMQENKSQSKELWTCIMFKLQIRKLKLNMKIRCIYCTNQSQRIQSQETIKNGS